MKPWIECSLVQQLQSLCRRLRPDHPSFAELHQLLHRQQIGSEAEKEVHFYLSQLPKSYEVLHNIRLLHDGQQAFQMDFVVVSEERLFIIEVKGYRGTIVFQHQDNRCFYANDDREEDIANPLLQVERHRTLLRQQLARHGWSDVPIHVFVTLPHKTTVRQHGGRKEAIVRDEAIAQQLLTVAPTNRRIPQRAISQYLVANHRARTINVLADWNIKLEDLRRGLLCMVCGDALVWERNCWYCHRCKMRQKDAIQRNIEEYVRIFGPYVKLKELLLFFRLKHRKTLWQYLKKYKRKGLTYFVSDSDTHA